MDNERRKQGINDVQHVSHVACKEVADLQDWSIKDVQTFLHENGWDNYKEIFETENINGKQWMIHFSQIVQY